MGPNISDISKKIWDIVKVAIFMIRKGLNKKKIFMDLNLMMKRGKIAGKTLKNIMSHNHHHHHNIHHFFTTRGGHEGGSPNGKNPDDSPQEYEFSCSDTPLYKHYFPKRRRNHQKHIITTQDYFMPTPPLPLEDAENINIDSVNNMLDMMLHNEAASGGDSGEICAASPLLPGLGFGKSPGVRQLRITDSPFPVQDSEEAKQVDQDAEDFIKKFYYQLKKQKF